MKALKYSIIIFFSVFALFIVFLLVSITPIFFDFSNRDILTPYTIISHRGGFPNLEPENSLSAIKNSLNFKIKKIEIDIQQTKDSILVVMHDKSINRTTYGKGNIKDMTYKELLAFNLKKSNNDKIPKLEEVLDLINGESNLVIEIKEGNDFYPEIEKRTIEMIHKRNAYTWCIIHSFDDKILYQVHKIDSRIRLQKVLICKLRYLPVIVDKRIHFGRIEDYDFIEEFNVCYWFANKEIIKKIHHLGKKVNAWTVDDKNVKKRLIKIGVDGIITNYPVE